MTALDSFLDEGRNRGKRFTVYRGEAETEVESQLSAHGIDVEREAVPPGGPDPFLVIEENGEFAGAISVTELEWLLEPPVVRPKSRDGVSAGYRTLFEALDGTVFTGTTRRQLLAVSREIEDRAYRVGTGTLRASFQTLSRFEPQVETYRMLATATDLDIHVHGVADWPPPEIPGVSFHEYSDDALELYWVVAFDGGRETTQACGLLARERDEGYRGFWTHDPATVEEILTELAEG